jgi:endogenous inhibitor of DNA gyrase (YacG/DUF329 family)
LLCPTCKKAIAAGSDRNPYLPFCSERCRLVDLGAWLKGDHRISSPVSEEEMDQGSGGKGDDDDPTPGHD